MQWLMPVRWLTVTKLGPGRVQARARPAGSDFYCISQKPKPAWAWILGYARRPGPDYNFTTQAPRPAEARARPELTIFRLDPALDKVCRNA
jgi:hypothetical protein